MLNIMFTRKCQESWRKLENFYKMIAEIGTKSKITAQYLLSRNEGSFIVDLCDMMLQNKSPKAEEEQKKGGSRRIEMGDGGTKAPFGPLVSLLCHLVCCLTTETMQDAELTSFTEFDDPKDSQSPK